MIGYTVITDAASEPLTKIEVRFQLKNEGITADDDLLDIYIKAARQLVEERTNTAMIVKTIRQTFAKFPFSTTKNPLGALKLAVSPLSSVTTVSYKDGDGDSQTIASDLWDIDLDIKPGLVAPVPSYSWPSTYSGLGAVTVTYVAGYATASKVPTALKQAMLLAITDWYRNRVDKPKVLPSMVDYLLEPYRVSEF